MSTINIALTSDNNYAQYMGVCIFSILKNKKNHIIFNFFILDGGISSKNKKIIKKIVFEFNSNIIFIKIDKNQFNNLKINGHASKAVYFRIQIPNLIDTDINKILYLDSDCIINHDLSQLWEIDISNYALAAVENIGFDRHKTLGIPNNYSYFNSGVMLMNLQYFRKNNISEKIINFIINNEKSIIFWDQDGFNAILYKSWLPLNPCWNVQHSFFINNPDKAKTFSTSDLENAKNDKCILHFSSSSKPWHVSYESGLAEYYFKYLKDTPWYVSFQKTIWFKIITYKIFMTIVKLKRFLLG